MALPPQIACGTADGLDQRPGRPQEAFLVGIQYRHQRDFRHVQALAQQIDAHEHIELAQAQVANDLHALDGVDIRMQVAHPNSVFSQVLGEVLGHALGQRGHQHAIAELDALVNLGHEVVDLRTNRSDLHHRVDQTGWAHHQLGDFAGRLAYLIRTRRCRNIDAAW